MKTVVIILSIIIFIRTLSYAIYEIEKNNNKLGGISTIVIALIALVFPIVMVYIRGV